MAGQCVVSWSGSALGVGGGEADHFLQEGELKFKIKFVDKANVHLIWFIGFIDTFSLKFIRNTTILLRLLVQAFVPTFSLLLFIVPQNLT